MNQKQTMLSLLRRYGVSVAAVIGSILLTALLPTVSPASSIFIILSAILFSAWYGGLGPGIFSTLVGAVGIAHLMEPRGSIAIDSAEEVLRLILFVVTSLAVVFFASSRKDALIRLARVNEGLTQGLEQPPLIQSCLRHHLEIDCVLVFFAQLVGKPLQYFHSGVHVTCKYIMACR
jgi:K+-sensing histidine kinase KdpD